MVLRIPFATLLKVALAILLVAMVVKLWPVILMIAVALLLAVMLDPIVVWLEHRHVRRSLGITAVAFLLLAAFAVISAFVVPESSRQIGDLLSQLPASSSESASHFRPSPRCSKICGANRSGWRMPWWRAA